ncbi:MAG: sigma-70 family RNA polymerase sigma factor [Myxococcota bacterium]
MSSPSAPRLRILDQTDANQPHTPEEAFDQYARYIGAVALRLLGRTEEVDDIVQETFIELVTAWHTIEDPARLKGWLATVATRIVSKRLKRRRFRSLFWVTEEPNYEVIVSEQASPEERALIGQLYRELDRLPVDLRLAWTLRHVEGERLEAVAEIAGCSLATVKRRIRIAHERLQRRLGGYAGVPR